MALAQSSGNSQYEENVPTGGGNGSNQGENGGGGGNGSSDGSGSSSGSGSSGTGSSTGSTTGSPGGEFIPGSGVSSPDFGGSGGFGGDNGSGGIGENTGNGGPGSGSASSVTTTTPGISSLTSTPRGALAGALLAGAASDLTGEGTTSATPASSTSSGGSDLWILIAIGAVALLAVIGFLGYRRMRSGGPATA